MTIVLVPRLLASRVAAGEVNRATVPFGKNLIRVGHDLSLRCSWGGMSGQEILRSTVCLGTRNVYLTGTSVFLSAEEQDSAERFIFATQCGFTDWPEMWAWYSEFRGIPYTGQLVVW